MHREAMQYAQDALVARQQGNDSLAAELYEKAFTLEKSAAFSLLTEFGKEPTRSVLFRSAAALALEYGNLAEAEKLAAQGLAGNPPDEIAEELRNLVEDVNLGRHLELHHIQLDSTELQFSLSGKETGYGMVQSDEFFDRYKTFELLTYRTAERLLKRPYRTAGKVDPNIKNSFQPYLSVPRAASFAVTIKLGHDADPQQKLFDDYLVQDVIDNMIQGITLINEGKEDDLKQLIDHEDYFQNFLSLCKNIAPDGERIKQVGFTVMRQGSTVKLGYTRPKSRFGKSVSPSANGAGEHLRTITGTLRMADADKNRIKITDKEDNQQFTVEVPEGLADIVRMFWDNSVIATVAKKNKQFRLIDIDKATY